MLVLYGWSIHVVFYFYMFVSCCTSTFTFSMSFQPCASICCFWVCAMLHWTVQAILSLRTETTGVSGGWYFGLKSFRFGDSWVCWVHFINLWCDEKSILSFFFLNVKLSYFRSLNISWERSMYPVATESNSMAHISISLCCCPTIITQEAREVPFEW